MVGTRGWGKVGIGHYCVMSTAAWDNDKVLKMNNVDDCTMMWMCFMPLNCTLKNGYNDKFYVYFTMILMVFH